MLYSYTCIRYPVYIYLCNLFLSQLQLALGRGVLDTAYKSDLHLLQGVRDTVTSTFRKMWLYITNLVCTNLWIEQTILYSPKHPSSNQDDL